MHCCTAKFLVAIEYLSKQTTIKEFVSFIKTIYFTLKNVIIVI